MTSEEVLRAFGQRLAVGDAAGAAALFAADAIYDEPPAHFEGREAIEGFIVDFAATHHDADFTVLRALTRPDQVEAAAEWRWSYTRNADGERRVFEGACFITFRDGLIASWRGFSVRIN
ncbi:MAG TPA: nuclear transport factor 2 family protein [Ktedonobacterales bacterium]|nr:nuclear transport factor 2 family protein [Ktedonobacterales bacterium]